jgi:simple sugar transport system ATP-binding protein
MSADPHPAVELRSLTKWFGSVQANAGVNLRVEAGSIHGIIGENGAGKSTAMNLLYGMYRPDSGEILIRGKPCAWASPSDALASGIGMVHQHFMLAGPYSALDNILLGAKTSAGWSRWGVLDRRQTRARLDALASQFGLPVEWERPVEELAVGVQQRIEILKLLYRDANILILDEPTAVLTPMETGALFGVLKKLRDQGKTILLVTHKLKEVMSVTDCVTVFRAGKVTGQIVTARTNPQELANLMVGRKVLLNLTVPPAQPRPEPALEVAELSLSGPPGSRHRLAQVSFTVRRGEIVGIAGVEGNGQSELLQAVLHPRDAHCRTSGTVRVMSQAVTDWPSPKIRALGVGLIPEDRLLEGLLPERPLTENFLLGLHGSSVFNRAGFLQAKVLEEKATQALEAYDVRPRDPWLPAGKLSGGNQQKLIVAREFQRQPQLLLAAQPTRGVDVGSIEFIHQRIVRARDEGAGVLLISSELEEIMALSDRILVLYEGRVVAEFQRGAVTERELGLKMGGS